ncbi:Hsp33 family molecular chaperone HslO [Clostridium isatidis]|uniref:Molecular chaperone Hsp33 n=1 Tax=Clostridium isatidis TaxID=182773 RepID=A0A343JBC6_9CLOT|nr:Hsp33 family molecular chaperone HslO [Clostridium isatidis]ASW42834.1 hypothetical protein BEN51_04925 [Clostridium isatidis]
MEKNLIKLLTKDNEIRMYITDARDIIEYSNIINIKSGFSKELYRKIFICCCLLRGLLTERDQRLDISIRFKPDGYFVYCNIDGEGNIHCTFSPKLRVFNGTFKDLIGKGATMSISKGSWMAGMFTGTIDLRADSIEGCFTDFYSRSEQLETIFKIWVHNGTMRGCMIQPLPFVEKTNLKYLIDYIDSNQNILVSGKWTDLPAKLSLHTRVIEEYKVQVECNCTREMFFGILMSVETEELKKSIQLNISEELECGICGKKYLFDAEDLKQIVKVKEGI